MWTRDNEQIQLNEVHALCMEAADHFHAALAKACVADLEPVYAIALGEHRKAAAELAECIRAQDDQPKLPDPDKETLELFITSIRARFATSERETLVEDQIKVEEKLRETLESALQSNVRPEAKGIMKRLLANVEATLQVLRKK